MKLCKEANPSMDDATKLQYLKDGLKPSLHFDVLLKNPRSTEEFLEHAQKVEELKSLDEKDNIIDQAINKKTIDSFTVMSKNRNVSPSQTNQPSSSQQLGFNNSYKRNQFSNNNNLAQQHITTITTKECCMAIPKSPYQCYNCGADDHFIHPLPIFIFANVNEVLMKIMFDSGATKSFINKVALKRTKHLPIASNQQYYLMADGYTTFEVIDVVKIFIEFCAIKTNIVVDIVNSLYTDCILGMDYINKYKVNLNNEDKQIQIHTFKNTITIPMENQIDNVKILCRLINSTYTQVSSGQLLFSPAYHLTHYKNLISPHALISIINHSAWIFVYNPTSSTCYLKSNIIIGTAVPSSTVAYISIILDIQTQDTIDESNTTSLTSINEQNIKNLIMHIQDQQQFISVQAILTRHHQLFDTTTTTTTIAETTKAHVIHTDKFPLPNLEQALQLVGDRKYYTKLDLRSGYFQIPIREKDKHKTAFITHIDQALLTLDKHKFQLNPQKCELIRISINYLGHTISFNGTKPLQDRIEKILSIPQPTSLKQANAFIGAIGWYRKYIKDYTKLIAPILAVTNLITRNKYKFKWDTPKCEAFDPLKNILITEPLF
ncbi:unnamed protein product [Rotaria sordida]|uniref:Reverse transcriptase/retrotransposon-derived protein RNase H-like domain-containing protein n=1 Tax=Rotaria sordida TaxID=392033 RepID=A0A815QY46_9BILA|nr:unnamed protein product [Rotaria sordida]